MIGLGVTVVLLLVASRYTTGGRVVDGGTTSGATMGLDRSTWGRTFSLSSLEVDNVSVFCAVSAGFSEDVGSSCVSSDCDGGSDGDGSIATLASRDNGSPDFFPFSDGLEEDRVGSQSLVLDGTFRSTCGISSLEEKDAEFVTEAADSLPVRRKCEGGVRYCADGGGGVGSG